MDKSWMNAQRFSYEHVKGVQSFMNFVKDHMGAECDIRCPCADCLNVRIHSQEVVSNHLLFPGINKFYTRWIYHGESREPNNDKSIMDEEGYNEDGDDEDDGLQDMLCDMNDYLNSFQVDNNNSGVCNASQMTKESFEKLLREAQQELYPGCSNSTLSSIVRLLHLKVYNKWSNKSFDMLLDFLKTILPKGETLPKSHYEANSMLRELGLGYISIHACKYDCVIYWKDFENHEECPICGTSRWKVNDGKGKKIPHKVLRYFPLKPRLQRLFMSKKTTLDMRWHKEKRINDDNIMQHPADSKAWKHFDSEFPGFEEDCRNVRLGLATDGFNPFGNMSNSYSMWPVILTPYNLTPWKCMKEPFLMMSLLIPGRNSPGKDIDVYLQPLIDELKELWDDGVQTYDASSGEHFQMHAAILWTINDFPAYGNLSGWSTKGYMACPVCNHQTSSLKLRNKICYMGHRRYLSHDHKWRRSKKFDGKPEHRPPPMDLSGYDLLQQLAHLGDVIPGKHPDNRKRKRSLEELNWTNKSILFDLPYWKHLLLRHNLDVMHVEKNICDNVLGTLMGIEGKTKDTIKARQDLEDLNIRKELHLKKRDDGSYTVPFACYTMSKKERQGFCEFLKSVKFPDGYASNISRCANVIDGKVSGLKSHDCHVLLQRLLPIGIRGCLLKDVSIAVAELGDFFQRLCCKTLKLDEIEKMEKDIVLILCKLEMIFPPSFFDVMVHLAIHLPTEAKLCGPVQFRWMYPIERFLGTLKQFVRNKARPEGSIAEAYIAKECLTFCSMYLQGIETQFNREERNFDVAIDGGLPIFSQKFRPIGASKYIELSKEELDMAHWFILTNCEEIDLFIEKHKDELKNEEDSNVEERHKATFASWFRRHMIHLYNRKKPEATEALYSLACGPHICAKKYTGCIINGVRFHTTDRDGRLKSQNSGILVEGNHKDEAINFYGVLNDIIELDYIRGRKVVVFKCKWFNLGDRRRGMHIGGKITSINVSKFWYENDPFILACQAKQVFYLDDTTLGSNWRVVQQFQHRHIFDVQELEDEQDLNNEAYQKVESNINEFNVDIEDHEIEQLHRDDPNPNIIDGNIVQNMRDEQVDDFLVNDDNDEDETLDEYCTDVDDTLGIDVDVNDDGDDDY